MDKEKVNSKQNQKPAASPKMPAPVPARVAPLFRKLDWFAMLFTFAVRPKYTELTMRNKRAVSEGSRRMISAIWEL